MIFEDRNHAGMLLARTKKLRNYKDSKSTAVLGIPRGGIVPAKVLSDKLNLQLSFVVTKKIGAPKQSELAIGAVGPEGTVVLDNNLISDLEVSLDYIKKTAQEKTDEVARRIVKYNGQSKIKLSGKTVILVDDGIATGATVEAAIKYLRNKKVKKIVLAVPVAPKSALLKFSKLVDELVVLHSPFSFNSVGQFYRDFPQVTDNEVIELLSGEKI